MDQAAESQAVTEITELLHRYFDGLYNGDLDLFADVFHPNSHLYASDGENLTDWPREDYFKVIAGRAAPSDQGLARHDRIISIHMSGPDTAIATVNCAIPPRYFTDYLTVIRLSGKWQIISKTFHTEVKE